jgi:hypothetical protein
MPSPDLSARYNNCRMLYRFLCRGVAIHARADGDCSGYRARYGLSATPHVVTSVQVHNQYRFALPLTHRYLVAPVLALVEPHRAERERQPAEIVGKANHQNDPAGNRSDCGALDKFR